MIDSPLLSFRSETHCAGGKPADYEATSCDRPDGRLAAGPRLHDKQDRGERSGEAAAEDEPPIRRIREKSPP